MRPRRLKKGDLVVQQATHHAPVPLGLGKVVKTERSPKHVQVVWHSQRGACQTVPMWEAVSEIRRAPALIALAMQAKDDAVQH